MIAGLFRHIPEGLVPNMERAEWRYVFDTLPLLGARNNPLFPCAIDRRRIRPSLSSREPCRRNWHGTHRVSTARSSYGSSNHLR